MASERQINRLPGLLAIKMIREQISFDNRLAHQSTTSTNKRCQWRTQAEQSKLKSGPPLMRKLAPVVNLPLIRGWVHSCQCLTYLYVFSVAVYKKRLVKGSGNYNGGSGSCRQIDGFPTFKVEFYCILRMLRIIYYEMFKRLWIIY